MLIIFAIAALALLAAVGIVVILPIMIVAVRGPIAPQASGRLTPADGASGFGLRGTCGP